MYLYGVQKGLLKPVLWHVQLLGCMKTVYCYYGVQDETMRVCCNVYMHNIMVQHSAKELSVFANNKTGMSELNINRLSFIAK